MATQVFYESVLSTAKLMDVNAEHSVETEILLADYDAPVFKIVKTVMEHSITQKYIMQNKLTVEGFIKLCIWYQPPSGGNLTVITQKIPFTKQLEITSNNLDDSFIVVAGQCQYVNTRPQNSTRIAVRGAYLFNIRVFAKNDRKAITVAKGQSVCCDNRQQDCFYLAGQNTRQFSLEDEIPLGEDMLKVVDVQNFAPVPVISVYGDKITVKGEIQSAIFYTIKDSGDIKKYTHTFLYNQIIDIPGVKENCIARADVSVSNFAMSQNSDTKKFTANMTVNIDAAAFSKQQIITVADAFSRRFECVKEEEASFTDSNIILIDKMENIKADVSVPKEYTLSHVVFEVSPVKSYFEINKTTVKAKVTAHVIGTNSHNEYECFTADVDMVLPWLENCRQQDEIWIKPQIIGYTITQSEKAMQINANCSVQGFVIEKQPCNLMKSFEENTEKPLHKGPEALIIYYGQRGEKVFDIAKQHFADPQEIIEENDLQTDRLTAPQMLFIPAFEQ